MVKLVVSCEEGRRQRCRVPGDRQDDFRCICNMAGAWRCGVSMHRRNGVFSLLPWSEERYTARRRHFQASVRFRLRDLGLAVTPLVMPSRITTAARRAPRPSSSTAINHKCCKYRIVQTRPKAHRKRSTCVAVKP